MPTAERPAHLASSSATKAGGPTPMIARSWISSRPKDFMSSEYHAIFRNPPIGRLVFPATNTKLNPAAHRVRVDPAFFVVAFERIEPAPAAGAGIFVGQCGRRADHTADTAIALVIEFVVRQVVLADVVPEL